MAGNLTTNTGDLIRDDLWSAELREILREELQATKYVDWRSDFPDGDTLHIPQIADAITDDYVEDAAIVYNALGTNDFTLTIDKYKSSAHYITRKMMQDSYYMNELASSFVPKQARAIMESLETDILAKGAGTANDAAAINGVSHRIAGGNAGVIEVADFAYAMYALKKAHVPQTNMVAIVDPSVEFQLNTLSQLTSVSNNPRWEGIVSDGIASGMRFVANVYGFDVYTSNFLPTATGATLLNDRAGGTPLDVSTGKCNYFFSATSDVLPFVGAMRQEPIVDREFNKDYQREELVTTARWGTKVIRPENLVNVVTLPTIA
jgi:hypothetical protein